MIVASFLPYVTCCWYDATSPYGKSLILFDSLVIFAKLRREHSNIGEHSSEYKPKSHFSLETISLMVKAIQADPEVAFRKLPSKEFVMFYFTTSNLKAG